MHDMLIYLCSLLLSALCCISGLANEDVLGSEKLKEGIKLPTLTVPPPGPGPGKIHTHDLNIERDGNNLISTQEESVMNIFSTTQPRPIVSSCQAFINHFSDVAANYTKCAVQHARPLQFCKNCVDEYLAAKSTFREIMQGISKDDSGALCGDMILNSDRVQIIVQTDLFIEDLWQKCNCHNCFHWYEGVNSTETYQDSNDTLKFLQLVQDTRNCFRNYTPGMIIPFIQPANSSANYSEVCIGCYDVYKDLNDFYGHLEDEYSHRICMDLVDAMNYTRRLWSETFSCVHQKKDLAAVLILSAFFALLPVIFYVGNRIHGTKLQNKIVKQKRMRDAAAHFTSSVESEEIDVIDEQNEESD